MQSSEASQPFEERMPRSPAMASVPLKHVSRQTPLPKKPALQVTGLFSTNAAGTHLSPVGHSSCFVDFCCAAGIAASEMHTPWLLPDFLLVQHACGGGPASADGAGAPHA